MDMSFICIERFLRIFELPQCSLLKFLTLLDCLIILSSSSASYLYLKLQTPGDLEPERTDDSSRATCCRNQNTLHEGPSQTNQTMVLTWSLGPKNWLATLW